MDSPSAGRQDAVQAFNELRAEVSVLRRAVEALPESWYESQPTDPTLELARLTQRMDQMAAQLEAIQKHPAWQTTPQAQTRAFEEAAASVVHETVQRLDQVTRSLGEERNRLVWLVGTVRQQAQQRNTLIYVGIMSLVLGMVLAVLLASILPSAWSSRLAALMLQQSRWEAAQTLMHAEDPQRWYSMMQAWQLAQANQATLAACSQAAARAKQEQRCTIKVPKP